MMRWYKLPVNPEPWAIGNVGMGRRNGAPYAFVGRNNQLASFKEAVADELRSLSPDLLDGPVRLCLYFWRNRAEYEGENKKTVKSSPDTTNMQKATEDACQGILFENDRQVVDVHSILVESGVDVNGRILIGVEEWENSQLSLELFNSYYPPPAEEDLESTRERNTWGGSNGPAI